GDGVEETGEPDRAEFVRLSRAMERLPNRHPERERLSQRAERLLEANRARWLAGLPAYLRKDASLHGGTSLEVKLQAEKYLASGRRLLDRAGVRGVTLFGACDRLGKISTAGAPGGARPP